MITNENVNQDLNRAVLETNKNWTTAIDEIDENTVIVAEAEIGTATSDPHWRIKKITTSGTVTLIQWAQASDRFEFAFNDRLSYTYS